MGAVKSQPNRNITKSVLFPKHSYKTLSELYDLGKKVGHGAFASVHRCFRKSDCSEFAVKVIDFRYLSTKEKNHLRSEIEILRHISHPNIIKLMNVFMEGTIVSIVLELCQEKDLFDAIVSSENQQFGEEKAAKITDALCDGLQHLHSHGIIHRDLKPENILFGINDATVKISDFGLAHYNNSDGSDGSCDDYESIVMKTCCGTPHYVAPEIISGKEYNYKCDCWSLGVILFVMLAGYQPFHADTVREVYAAVRKAKYDFNSIRWVSVSKEAKHLVKGLLELDPVKRYSTADVKCHEWIKKYVDR